MLLYLPFLQMRLARPEPAPGACSSCGRSAPISAAPPWAFALAFVVTLLFALPLYLLKIEIVPREAAWLPSLVFIAFIFPARLLTGWAWAGRTAGRRRGTGSSAGPAACRCCPRRPFYVLIVFFTQFTSWNGVWSLYEQHAFLVPVPFFGM